MKATVYVLVALLLCGFQESDRLYVCPPCDCPAHEPEQTFASDGHCPYCGMNLIEKTDGSRINQVDIHTGSGNFLIKGGSGHEDKSITVFYHMPESFSTESPVLIVVPGTGRNGYDYRDAWIEASERHGVLVLSPQYPEATYGFGDYHMGGLMGDINLAESVEYVENTNEVRLDEEALAYEVNSSPAELIFSDFDRMFEMTAEAVGSTRTSYDIFGHSAGGQILHRFVIFYPGSKADRILASNAGFYTLPGFDEALPFGLENAPVDEDELEAAFGKCLVLFLGELDDAKETGGLMLRSPTVDEQGAGRLARGRYFYRTSKAAAQALGAPFNWTLEVIPDIGHDYVGMSAAAAEYLYE
ncbi:MAG: hypothetical protein ACREVN_10520 [Gammaproteobacteria bacterium]